MKEETVDLWKVEGFALLKKGEVQFFRKDNFIGEVFEGEEEALRIANPAEEVIPVEVSIKRRTLVPDEPLYCGACGHATDAEKCEECGTLWIDVPPETLGQKRFRIQQDLRKAVETGDEL